MFALTSMAECTITTPIAATPRTPSNSGKRALPGGGWKTGGASSRTGVSGSALTGDSIGSPAAGPGGGSALELARAEDPTAVQDEAPAEPQRLEGVHRRRADAHRRGVVEVARAHRHLGEAEAEVRR